MSYIKSIDSLLNEKAECTWNCRSSNYNFYYRDYVVLKQGIDELAELTAIGKIDLCKTEKIIKVIAFLSHKIDENNLTYWELLTNDVLGDIGPFTYTISDDDALKFKALKALFKPTREHYSEFMRTFSPDKCSSYDTTADDLIQKINPLFPLFPYEISSKRLIVVDKDDIYADKPGIWDGLFPPGKVGCSYIYMTDSNGKKWKTNGIPLGSRTITQSIETLEILVKKTKRTGETVTKPLLSGLPEHLKETILTFIRLGRPHAGFVCHDFVSLFQDPDNVDYSSFASEKDLSPGDAICLTGQKRTENDTDLSKFVATHKAHSAIYLGQKLFISIYGGIGPLKISSLPAMRQFTGYKDVIVMRTPSVSESL